RVAAGAWVVAAIAATAAFLAGQFAADSLLDVPPQAQVAIGAHADLATAVLWVAWSVALLRVAAAWRPDQLWSTILRAVAIIGGVGLVGLVVWTADLGGGLVYQHGLAVASEPCPTCEPAAAAQPFVPSQSQDGRDLLEEQADGSWAWTPVPEDAPALGAGSWPGKGAVFTVDGSHELMFEPDIGDVQINVWLDLSAFKGEVRLLHHLKEGSSGSLVLQMGSGPGSARLLAGDSELNSAVVDLAGRHAVAVNAAGSHFKGMVDGRTVVHGHSAATKGGQAGLQIAGTGRIVVERVELVPLGGP
ncbi:MAG: hypothetical protein AB8H79_18635, partial [Myxococcota bacterium]